MPVSISCSVALGEAIFCNSLFNSKADYVKPATQASCRRCWVIADTGDPAVPGPLSENETPRPRVAPSPAESLVNSVGS